MIDLKEKDLLINVSLKENGISTTISFDKDLTSESESLLAHLFTPANVNALLKELVKVFNKNDKAVYIKHGSKLIKANPNEIVRLKAARNYCDIILQDGTVLDVCMPMNEVHELLDPNLFRRINRSTVVNRKYVKEIIGNMVRLTDGKILDIGTKYRTDIFALLKIIGSRRRVTEKKDDSFQS